MIRRALLAVAALAVVTAGYFVGREVVRQPSPPAVERAAPVPAAPSTAAPETASQDSTAAPAAEAAGLDVLAPAGDPPRAGSERRARRQERRERLGAAGRLAPERPARGERPDGVEGRRSRGPARPGGFERPVRPDGAVMALELAVRERASGAWVEGEGRVERVLRDDLRGRQHQRFVVELAAGGTLLVAHNTRLAGRAPVAVGETVRFHGRYEWNARGGIVHWTHRDPRGRGGGWLELAGRRYE